MGTFTLLILPFFWILFNISCLFIIFTHEMAHAIPALFFTKENVSIYIGSYGDERGPKITIGKLTIYFKLRFFYTKTGGLCKHSRTFSIFKELIILISGPVITFFIALTLFYIVFTNDAHGFFKAFTAVLLAASLISLIVNLYPRKIFVNSAREFIYTDGHQIISVIKSRKYREELLNGIQYFNNSDFFNAVLLFEKVSERHIDKHVFNLLIGCYVKLNDFNSAKKIIEKYSDGKLVKFDSEDYGTFAWVDIQLMRYTDALIMLDKSLTLEPESFSTLNSRGFVKNMLNNYMDAKEDLSHSIEINPESIYGYCNRAFSNIKLSLLDDAAMDINKALSLDNNFAYAYFVNGMYHFEKRNWDDALLNFEKAKQIDPETMSVDEYITRVKEKITN